MTNQQPTQPPPKSGAAPVITFVLAIAGWLGAIVCVLSAADADDPTQRYFLGLVLAIIGTGMACMVIVATLLDIAGRRD